MNAKSDARRSDIEYALMDIITEYQNRAPDTPINETNLPYLITEAQKLVDSRLKELLP